VGPLAINESEAMIDDGCSKLLIKSETAYDLMRTADNAEI